MPELKLQTVLGAQEAMVELVLFEKIVLTTPSWMLSLVYVSAGICAVPSDAESLWSRIMSSTMGEAGDKTLTVEPVLEVNETEMMGTLKLTKETPVGGASATVTVKFAVPDGGGTVPLGRPLQELSANTARTSRMEKLREKRFMWHPMPEDKYVDANAGASSVQS